MLPSIQPSRLRKKLDSMTSTPQASEVRLGTIKRTMFSGLRGPKFPAPHLLNA